jgi:hypothetical protein
MAIQRTAQIVLDLIPHIYDTKRMIQIIGDDGKPALKEINRPMMIEGVEKVLNDVTVGAYDVVIEQGPGYATKRQEAAESMTAFIQAFPPAAPLIGDLYAKVQDWPHSEEIGERLEEALPPAIKGKLQSERAKAEQKPGEPPPPPTPEQQQAAKASQMQDEAAMLELEEKKAQVKKTNAEAAKIAKDAGLAGPDPDAAVQAQVDAHLRDLEVASKEDEYRTKVRLNAIKVAIEEANLAKARVGLHQAGEKHVIDMVGRAENLAQGAEKHEAGMTEQHVSMAQGHEKHAATIERMKQPAEAEA